MISRARRQTIELLNERIDSLEARATTADQRADRCDVALEAARGEIEWLRRRLMRLEEH